MTGDAADQTVQPLVQIAVTPELAGTHRAPHQQAKVQRDDRYDRVVFRQNLYANPTYGEHSCSKLAIRLTTRTGYLTGPKSPSRRSPIDLLEARFSQLAIISISLNAESEPIVARRKSHDFLEHSPERSIILISNLPGNFLHR